MAAYRERGKAGGQLQTFADQKVSKSFRYSNAFRVKSLSQPLMFKDVTDKPTHMNKKLNFFHDPVAGEVPAAQTWHNDRGARARFMSFLHLETATVKIEKAT